MILLWIYLIGCIVVAFAFSYFIGEKFANTPEDDKGDFLLAATILFPLYVGLWPLALVYTIGYWRNIPKKP